MEGMEDEEKTPITRVQRLSSAAFDVLKDKGVPERPLELYEQQLHGLKIDDMTTQSLIKNAVLAAYLEFKYSHSHQISLDDLHAAVNAAVDKLRVIPLPFRSSEFPKPSNKTKSRNVRIELLRSKQLKKKYRLGGLEITAAPRILQMLIAIIDRRSTFIMLQRRIDTSLWAALTVDYSHVHLHITAPLSSSKFTCQFTSQASSPDSQQPTPMRLSHFFVVVAAAFLATGALADTNVASVSLPSHRNLRKRHHTVEAEERGINNIPLERLHSLGRRVGVNADDVLADAAAAMRSMSHTQQKAWSAGISKLLKMYREKPKHGRIKPINS